VDRIDAHVAHLPRHRVDDAMVDAWQPLHRRRSNAAADALLQVERRRDVVGVDVRVQGAGEREPQVVQHLQVRLDPVDDRVDQDRLPGFLAARRYV
jgi:hypothetical protein